MPQPRPKDLTIDERNRIVQLLLVRSMNGRPSRGKILELSIQFGRSRQTIRRVSKAAKAQMDEGQVINLVSAKKTTKIAKKVQIDLQLIESLPVLKRGTIRRLTNGIGAAKSTFGRWCREGLIKSHTNAIKPSLTAQCKLLRLQFSLEALEFDRILNRLKFKNMHNTIHIDEKWFYMTKSSQRMYLTPSEVEPHRTCQNKKFITKIMFMCVVCRPMFLEDGSVLFDGKIDIFPFTRVEAAVRNNKNRQTDTLLTKPIESITKEVIKECLITNILTTIREKWPEYASKQIFIQQDNARPHIKDCDPDFRRVATEGGFDIRLMHQPPNSPDTNVLDLGWFRAIQSTQITTNSYTVDQLVNVVCASYEELSPHTLYKVFVSLQGCIMEIMRVKGQNCYRIPHMNKEGIIRQGLLPYDLEVPLELVKECLTYMLENRMIEDVNLLRHRLGF